MLEFQYFYDIFVELLSKSPIELGLQRKFFSVLKMSEVRELRLALSIFSYRQSKKNNSGLGKWCSQ